MQALTFLTNRWSNAARVNLDLSLNEADSQKAARLIMRKSDLPKMKLLKIKWAGSSSTLAMLLSWLVRSTEEVHLMQLHVREMPPLPCVSNLTALKLVWDEGCGSSIELAATQLPSLESLSLSFRSHHRWYPAAHPSLDLNDATKLKTLDLSNVVPVKLRIPSSCGLYVNVLNSESAKDQIWQQPGLNLQTFEMSLDDGGFEEAFAIVDGLNPIKPVDTIIIRADDIGSSEAPVRLKGALTKACIVLLFAADSLNVILPEDFLWRRLRLVSEKDLGVRFADVSAFVRKLPVFTVSCSKLLHMGALVGLMQALQGLGSEVIWGGALLEDGVSEFNARQKGHQEPDFYDICTCGACSYCLPLFIFNHCSV